MAARQKAPLPPEVALAILLVFAAIAAVLWASGGGSSGGGADGVHVRGYHRADGTYVAPHVRSRPRH